MAITKAAKKAIRVSERKRVFNVRRKRTMKEAIKSVLDVVKTDKKTAESNLSAAYKAIDKAVKRNIITKNTAARRKSRLARAVAGK